MIIYLHDDLPHYVEIDSCPWEINRSFESYIIDFFGHYRNHLPPLPVMEWPVWLKEGLAHLSQIACMDEDDKRRKGMDP